MVLEREREREVFGSKLVSVKNNCLQDNLTVELFRICLGSARDVVSQLRAVKKEHIKYSEPIKTQSKHM